MKIHESPQALTCQCMCSDHHGLQKTNSTVKQVSSSQPKHLLPIAPNAKPQIPTDKLKHHTPVYRYPFAKFSQIWQPLPYYLYSETLILFLLAGPLKTKIPTAPSSCRILENPNYQLSCTIAKFKILRFAYKDLKDTQIRIQRQYSRSKFCRFGAEVGNNEVDTQMERGNPLLAEMLRDSSSGGVVKKQTKGFDYFTEA